MSLLTEQAPPPAFEWRRWPETQAFIDELVVTALEGNAFAADLAGRMQRETGTPFHVWLDHLVIRGGPSLLKHLATLGYQRQPISYSVGVPVFAHSGGIFPRLAVLSGDTNNNGGTAVDVPEVAIKVESVSAFSRAHDLGLEVLGYPMGPYRVGRIPGRTDDLGRGRASRLSGVRAVSR